MNSLVSNAYGLIVLRLGLVALFLWFGVSQLLNPNDWLAWLPQWTSTVAPFNTLSPLDIVRLNGGFEVVFGLLLLLGLWTRWVALILSLHLFFIAYEVGYNDIGVRDFALGVCTLALAIFGPDKFSLSRSLPQKPLPRPPLF
jgi:uncharacterized membrane protein YphA (DoxX/SURF4 family)